jgi:hypothetical protein
MVSRKRRQNPPPEPGATVVAPRRRGDAEKILKFKEVGEKYGNFMTSIVV